MLKKQPLLFYLSVTMGRHSAQHKPEDLPGLRLIAELSGEKPDLQMDNATGGLFLFVFLHMFRGFYNHY